MRSNRMKRMDDLIREIIGEALLTKVDDPRIGMVSVTKVEVSKEFDTAKVWVSVYGDEEVREQSLLGLRSAARFLQSEIAREARMRRTPRLRFIYDDSIERSFRIGKALSEVDPPAAPNGDESSAPEGDEEGSQS